MREKPVIEKLPGEWLALAAVPAHSLKTLKESNGAGFIRKWGFDTRKADEAYGPDWLEK